MVAQVTQLNHDVRCNSNVEIETRLRVTADLICECVRNAAYYSSGWETCDSLINQESDFWVNVNGNCLDIAVLAWCALFGDPNAEFRWQRLFEDHASILADLHQQLNITELDFDKYVSEMRTYRDKRVAHRDRYMVGDPRIIYPSLDTAVKSCSYLYQALVAAYPQMAEVSAYQELEYFHSDRFDLGQAEYKKSMQVRP